MTTIEFGVYDFQTRVQGGARYIRDIVRKKYVLLTPEEWVRQHILHFFIREMHYPKGLISVEKSLRVNQLLKRYDIVVYNRQQRPWMLVECKEGKVGISDQTLGQLLQYHQVLQCPFWLLTNGYQHFCAEVTAQKVAWLSRLPAYADGL